MSWEAWGDDDPPDYQHLFDAGWLDGDQSSELIKALLGLHNAAYTFLERTGQDDAALAQSIAETRDVLDRVGPKGATPPALWRPMTTAPRDGTSILGFMPSYYQGRGGQSVILWQGGSWWDNRAFKTEPTHWMHLMPPPTDRGVG